MLFSYMMYHFISIIPLIVVYNFGMIRYLWCCYDALRLDYSQMHPNHTVTVTVSVSLITGSQRRTGRLSVS